MGHMLYILRALYTFFYLVVMATYVANAIVFTLFFSTE